jgi:hypothetical protein
MVPLEHINNQLKFTFGQDISSSRPMFRIVFSDDEREHRHGTWEDYDRNGTKIREVTETREVPKYPWIKGFYVLEHLVAVPEINMQELAGKKVSYEPIWVFRDDNKMPLPPRYDVCCVVIESMREGMKRARGAKYKQDNSVEAKEVRIQGIMDELFGNETRVGDGLAHKSGVGYTGPVKEK